MYSKGFTLLELLSVLTISLIIVQVGIPTYRDLLQRHQSRVAIYQVLNAVNFARATAVTQGATVSICPRRGTDDCGREWRKGLIVFVDANSNGDREESDRVLLVSPPFPENSSMTWSSFGSNNHLRFVASGATINQNGSFTYCPPSKNAVYARQVVVNKIGRARLAMDRDGNGIRENARQEDISCN
ncbi:MAG: GspH/FimT family pseudopilin [Cellvibrionaceae bacterium]